MSGKKKVKFEFDERSFESGPSRSEMPQNLLAAPAGSDAPDVSALGKWMQEVTQLLCYQPEVPMKHKEELCNALNEYNQIVEAQRLAQQNGEAERQVKGAHHEI